MQINKIEIKNFRQYQNVLLDFSSASKYNLNYILAENGIGKTTLLNAITWCLYGEELHITNGLEDKILPLLTLQTIRGMDCGDEKDSEVKLVLSEDGGIVEFIRSYTFRKTEESKLYKKKENTKVIIKPDNKDVVVLTGEEKFNEEVTKRIPRKIQQFFFFDGEQLDTYLSTANGLKVEQVVLGISGIDLLVTMEKNLDIVAGEIRKEASSKNPNTKKLNSDFEEKKQSVIDLEEKLNNDEANLEKAEIRLKHIKDELGDDPDIGELQEKRDNIEAILENRKSSVKENDKKIKSFLKESYINLTSLSKVRSLYDLILRKQADKQLPPKYDPAELREMLNQSHCFICNRDLDLDASAHIINLLKRFEINSEAGSILTGIRGSLHAIIKQSSNYATRRDELFGERSRLENEINNLADELKNLDSIIDKYTDKDHILKLYAEQADLTNAIERLKEDVVLGKKEISTLKKELERDLKELEAAIKADDKVKVLQQESKFAEDAKEKVSKIIAGVKGGIRKKISDEMSNKFFEFMWKKKIKSVELNDKYTATVINDDGFEALGSISAAERELLVLAFTLALHKESGFEGPLVIDTPIARISGDLRVSFAKVLKEVSAFKQIILFVTEDEYSTNVKDVFEPIANNKYKLILKSEDYVDVEVL